MDDHVEGGATPGQAAGSNSAAEDELDPRVRAALDRVADSAEVDLNQVPEVLSDVYQRLHKAMTDPEGE